MNRTPILQGHSERIAWALAVLITLVLTGTFPPQEFIRDSLGWARVVDESQVHIWHPHHLIYMPVNWVIQQGLSLVCNDCNAITAGQLHSQFWAVVLALAAVALFRRLTGSIWVALLFTLSLLVVRSIWVLLMQPQSYSASYALMVLLIAALFMTRDVETKWQSTALITFLYALSVLYHQAMVLLGLPLAYYLIATRRNGWLTAVQTLALAGAMVLAFYIFAAYLVIGSINLRAFWEYLTLFGQVMSDPNYFDLGNLKPDRIQVLAQAVVDSIVVLPWRMRPLLTGLIVLSAVLVVAWNFLCIARRAEFIHERITLFMIAAMFSFLCLWGSPEDYAWQVFILIPLMIMAALAAADFIRGNRFRPQLKITLFLVMIASVGLIAARNLNETIIPMHQNKGKDYAYAQAIADVIPKECIIFEKNMHVYYNLIYYFKRATTDYWDIITAFYYSDSAHINDKILSDKDRHNHCIAIDSAYLEPGFNVSGKTGFDKANEWKTLLFWLFDLRQKNENNANWRAFNLVAAGNSRHYIIIKSDQREVSAPGELFQHLLMANLQHNPKAAENYSRWIKANFLQ